MCNTMPHITEVVSIKADPKKVIDYIADVQNHPAFISALKSVANATGSSRQIGSSWEWTFVMGGVQLVGRAETAELQEEKVYSFRTTGGARSTFTYSVVPEGDGTRLTIDVEYVLPDTVLAKIANAAVLEKLNGEEAERAAENLKAILES